MAEVSGDAMRAASPEQGTVAFVAAQGDRVLGLQGAVRIGYRRELDDPAAPDTLSHELVARSYEPQRWR
ncbi:MAG: hypothetical protein ACR2LQ_14335 [Acidimicrobiales bacterium]